jgi:hypothetical protein
VFAQQESAVLARTVLSHSLRYLIAPDHPLISQVRPGVKIQSAEKMAGYSTVARRGDGETLCLADLVILAIDIDIP